MSKYYTPVDKYELRQTILSLPAIKVKDKGFCISIEDLNKAIDDISALSTEKLVKYLLKTAVKASKTPVDASLDNDLSKLLTYSEVREYAGMKPLNGHDEFLSV